MRTIKFRAWDKKREKMFDIAGIDSHGTISVSRKQVGGGTKMCLLEDEHLEQYGIFCDEDVELMQFTGLLDKNGKEIYEGDIVKIEGWTESVQEVLFNRGGFCLRLPHETEQGFYHDIKYALRGEVIGNIYENPELIK